MSDLNSAETVRARVEAIRERCFRNGRWDSEWAHGDEDALHEDVLRLIADGAPNAAELAHEALQTLELDFQRWCA